MEVIGVTGNSGTGKTTVANLLKEKLNAKLINADKIAKKVAQKGTKYYLEIIKYFGEDILNEEGQINRKKLATIIYSNKEQRDALNNFTTKYVVPEIVKEIQKSNKEHIILDVPLLFESGLDKHCTITVSLLVNEDIKLQRIIKRDNIDKTTAKNRLQAQSKNEYYKQNSTYIIENNNENLEQKVEEFCIKFNLIK